MKSKQYLSFLVLACFGVASAFFLQDKTINCSVSYWSEWSGTKGFGEYTRYRTVLAYPTNGGTPCPPLTDSKPEAGRQPTVDDTAKQFVDKFLRRTVRSTKSKRSTDETRDLLILLDDSGSIGRTQFRVATSNLAELLGLLCPYPDPFKNKENGYHRAAMIKFSSTPVEVFSFGQKVPTAKLKNAIKHVHYTNGSTCTGDAFKAALAMFHSKTKGVRNKVGVKKEVLILTDGLSNCGYNAVQAAKELKEATFSPLNDKVEVFGLIIGDLTEEGKAEVKQYVSDQYADHLFTMNNLDEFNKLVASVKRNINNDKPCLSIDG